MSILKEFKDFAMRGNVIDLAVGVIIGSAFTKIINSLVSDILTPFLGLFTSSIDFKDLTYVLKPAVDKIPALELHYGSFIQNVIDFIIVAFVIFMMVRTINKLHKKQEVKAPAKPVVTNEEKLLTEIRDLLKK